jgi:hypothetical protein
MHRFKVVAIHVGVSLSVEGKTVKSVMIPVPHPTHASMEELVL